MNEKVLFVDDEQNVLNGFRRQLRKKYEVQTADSGLSALQMLADEGPFAVVVTDMRMPEMNGVAFLKEVQNRSPESVRLMLTGNADQQTAIDAVNEGDVYRFLTKPCSLPVLSEAVDAAIAKYRVESAERKLLRETLNGTIKLLMDILSMAAPNISTFDISLRKTASRVARALGVRNDWEMEVATMLSRISHITLPPETLQRLGSGDELSVSEKKIVEHLPEAASKLLANIPKLTGVARIVLYQKKNFDGSGFPADSVAGDEIPIESRVLKVLHEFKLRSDRDGLEPSQVLDVMREQTSMYDPRVLEQVGQQFLEQEEESKVYTSVELCVGELRPGQVLASQVETESGKLLFTAGHVLTDAMVGRVLSYHEIQKIKEPISVSVLSESLAQAAVA